VKSLHVGSVRISPPVMLAPMAGYTDAAFRWQCMQHGCGASFTEVVNAEGIVHGSPMTMHLLGTEPGEHPVAAHIYGRNPDSMAVAAAIIAGLGRFDFIDINGGCPVRKIVAKGCGVALMKDPPRIEAIVRAIRGAVALPVTVKTRAGLKPDAVLVSDVAAAAEEQAASVEEVTASVNEVGGLMQSTAKESTDAAAASEESAAAIDQITKVVGNVNSIVDKVTKEVSKFKC